jgi:hypothetical protein
MTAPCIVAGICCGLYACWCWCWCCCCCCCCCCWPCPGTSMSPVGRAWPEKESTLGVDSPEYIDAVVYCCSCCCCCCCCCCCPFPSHSDDVLVVALAIDVSRLAWLGRGKDTPCSIELGLRETRSCCRAWTAGPGSPVPKVGLSSGAIMLDWM